MKEFIKKILLYTTYHRSDGRKNIFIFSAPRGGSTWLFEILATQKGYRRYNEPCNLRKAHVRKNLGINDWMELYSNNGIKKIDTYLYKLTNENIRDTGYKYPLPFTEFWRPVTHGTIFKILHACEPYIDHIKEKFNGKIILLLRHPIPVSLSREEYPRLEVFLKSDYAKFFTAEQIEFAWNIVENGNMLQKGVLDWTLQNAVPLWQQKKDWLIITYEDLVLHPEPIIDNLCSFLSFSNKDKMMARLNVASGSTTKSKDESKRILLDPQKLNENKKWLIEKWVKKAKETDIINAQKILDVFNIKLYNANKTIPNTPLNLQSF